MADIINEWYVDNDFEIIFDLICSADDKDILTVSIAYHAWWAFPYSSKQNYGL